MQRVVASLLIGLVGLMALIPQALCPCARRARTALAQAHEAGRVVDLEACCPRCLKRQARNAAHGAAPAPREAPPVCPCCEVNGDGKHLLQLGDVVRPAAPAGLELAAAPPLGLLRAWGCPVRALDRALDAVPDDLPPAERRAGVVLLI